MPRMPGTLYPVEKFGGPKLRGSVETPGMPMMFAMSSDESSVVPKNFHARKSDASPKAHLVLECPTEDMHVGEGGVLGPGGVAALVIPLRQEADVVVFLLVDHVAAIEGVLLAELIVNASDVLILIDRSRTGRCDEVERRRARDIRQWRELIEERPCIVADAARGNLIVREWISRLGIEQASRPLRKSHPDVGPEAAR